MPLLKLPEGSPEFGAKSPRSAESRKHRGGAWKVAYADFVTAMMALFIVLWMMNASGKVKESVSGYFKDPRGYSRKLGAGPSGSGEGLVVSESNVSRMQQQIEQALRQVPEFQILKKNIQFSVTGEGLRIDLLENEQGLFFTTGGAQPTEAGQHLLASLAAEVGRMPNSVVIEGHTDARPFRNSGPSAGYGNWELSVDRANAARRLLHQYGVRPQQVVEVRGFADERLLIPEHPEDPRNRRISLVVRF
ncbi:MAG TPA: flagellar motor protein MotB [Candidatus Sulfopaludibacter sp.]|jgi:chemotaxis protein MotB|nr:flagellar motor protein MotB [Candidatus Sulfopaludibacter sp.]